MESIKDKVAIIGMGCTRFGERWDAGVEDLLVEAAYEAFEDAGVAPKDMQAAWIGTVFSGMSAMTLAPLGLQFIPITRVENMCATGSEALRGAAYAVAAGVCDIALAIGVEKLKDSGLTGVRGPAVVGDNPDGSACVGSGYSAPASFAYLGTRYFHHYGIDRDEGKELLAKIAVKNHQHGSLNPKAHFHNVITVEQAVKAPIVAWPLGLFDCCGVSDGSAAAIVCRADMAKNFRSDPIYIKGMAISAYAQATDSLLRSDRDVLKAEGAKTAMNKAYQMSGLPPADVTVAEVHDCFSTNELIVYEDLGFSKRGGAKEDINSGAFTLQGDLPINTDGGLKCFGHPLGASGLRMLYEMYKQLQGKAGPRQVKNPHLALTHNLGGNAGAGIGCVVIVGNEKG